MGAAESAHTLDGAAVGPSPRLLRLHAAAPRGLSSASPRWGTLGEFLDSRMQRRLEHYLRAHAGHRWKPRVALVVPSFFSLARPTHLADLTAALELLAPVLDHYNLQVLSDSPDADRVLPHVSAYSPSAVASCSAALVILSRSLNERVSSLRPSRFVSADPCAYRLNQKRVVFSSGASAAGPVANAEQIARSIRGGISAFIDEDEGVADYIAALQALRARGIPLRVTLSTRSDDDFAQRVHRAFAGDPRVEVREPVPSEHDERAVFQISNEPIALLTQQRPNLARFLYERGAFHRLGTRLPRRAEFYLLRGEEAHASRLLASWLDTRAEAPAQDSPANTPTEPLVSIVVPVYDRTSEIIRLAHSIYQQDYPWIEVVFACNGSPPETLEAVRVAENYLMKRRYAVRILEMPHAFGCATIPRDIGIRSSTGELICLVDSDDWLEPGFFAFLHHAPWRTDTLYYPKRVFRNHGRAMRPGFPFDTPLDGLGTVEAGDLGPALERHGNFMCNSGVCFARALFDRAGGIDHRLTYGEDLYLWWRCALAGARAQEHDGRVNIALHPGNNELAVGQDQRLAEAVSMARGQELTEWL